MKNFISFIVFCCLFSFIAIVCAAFVIIPMDGMVAQRLSDNYSKYKNITIEISNIRMMLNKEENDKSYLQNLLKQVQNDCTNIVVYHNTAWANDSIPSFMMTGVPYYLTLKDCVG